MIYDALIYDALMYDAPMYDTVIYDASTDGRLTYRPQSLTLITLLPQDHPIWGSTEEKRRKRLKVCLTDADKPVEKRS